MTCTLYGSLGATGIGHRTPDAVVAGFQGLAPETVDPDDVRAAWADWPGGELLLDGTHPVAFEKGDIAFAPRTRPPGHPNAMTIEAWVDAAFGPPRASTSPVRETGAPAISAPDTRQEPLHSDPSA